MPCRDEFADFSERGIELRGLREQNIDPLLEEFQLSALILFKKDCREET